LDALTTALDLGVTFIDTADVYGDRHSEKYGAICFAVDSNV